MNLFKKRFVENPYVSLPRTLTRKRIYILPTRHGWRFILVLLAMLIGSVNYKNNLGFLLTFLLGSMALVSILHTYRNLSGVTILSVAAPPVFAGRRAVFKVHIRSDLPNRAAVTFAFLHGEDTLREIFADTDNWIEISAEAVKRGIFKPGDLRISTRYPFGLFYAWSNLHLDLYCLVFPKPIRSKFEPGSDSVGHFGDGGKNGIGAEDFEGLRAYQPGDSLQHIYWKAFSRGQGLLTKEFVGQRGATVMLDWHTLKDADTERKLSRLCDMVLKAHSLNLTYGLKLPGQAIDPGRGLAHRQLCLKALAMHALPSNQ